ncbi:MAG: hypothetical protein DWQ05_14015 [Calditrichaeota bacterium]|nr:MAG: hypothetical protein DWQ05_14015 [Calditrichota bacterium]
MIKQELKLNEAGKLQVILGVLIFSFISFIVTFGTMWLALIGPTNPFIDKGAELTKAELARVDSLRVVEQAILQQIESLENHKSKLNKSADSLITEINSHAKSITGLKDELTRLGSQVGEEKKERMKKLSGIVSGLSDVNLKRITEDLEVPVLVSLVMNSSGKRAKTIMNAMNPKRAALVAREMSRVKGLKTNGG